MVSQSDYVNDGICGMAFTLGPGSIMQGVFNAYESGNPPILYVSYVDDNGAPLVQMGVG